MKDTTIGSVQDSSPCTFNPKDQDPMNAETYLARIEEAARRAACRARAQEQKRIRRALDRAVARAIDRKDRAERALDRAVAAVNAALDVGILP